MFARQRPALLVDLAVMRAADQPEVLEPGRPAVRPEDQVMPVAPGRRPVTTRKDAVPIPGDQRPAGGWRDGAAGVAGFVLEFPESDDPGDGRVTGEPANRLGGYAPAPLELTGGGGLDPRQGIGRGRDDQLRPRP